MTINIVKASGNVVGIQLSNNLLADASNIADFVSESGFRFKGIDFDYPAITNMPPCEAKIKFETRNGVCAINNITLVPNSYLVITDNDIACHTDKSDLINNGFIEVEGEIQTTEDVTFIDLRQYRIDSPKDMFAQIYGWCSEEGLDFETFNIHGNENYSVTIDSEGSGEFNKNDILILDSRNGNPDDKRVYVYHEDFLFGDGYIIAK